MTWPAGLAELRERQRPVTADLRRYAGAAEGRPDLTHADRSAKMQPDRLRASVSMLHQIKEACADIFFFVALPIVALTVIGATVYAFYHADHSRTKPILDYFASWLGI